MFSICAFCFCCVCCVFSACVLCFDCVYYDFAVCIVFSAMCIVFSICVLCFRWVCCILFCFRYVYCVLCLWATVENCALAIVSNFWKKKSIDVKTQPMSADNLYIKGGLATALIAKKYLCAPSTAVPSDFFRLLGTVSKKRSSLLPENVNSLIFLNKNL